MRGFKDIVIDSCRRAFRPAGTVLVPLLAAAALTGCGSDETPQPDKIRIVDGNEQCVPLSADPGKRVAKKRLRVEVLTAARRGWLGGKGSRLPVPKEKILFAIVGRDRGATICPTKGADPVRRVQTTTDGGGSASCEVRVGNEAGGIVIEVSLPEHPYRKDPETGKSTGVKPVKFHITAGAGKTGDGQEASAGSSLQDPIALTLTGPDGKPLANVPVEWHVEKGPKGTRFTIRDGTTDADGRARAQLEMGSGTGQVIISAVAADPDKSIAFRPVRFRFFSLGCLGIIITVVGGLALFIMGMRLMTDGLARVAGARMKAILQAFTKNPVVGVGVGALMTGVVQSSSATSVMVIGFVNAGLLTLERAIGLIMGANIGTTVTAQMISFKLSKLALPAVAVGVAIQLLSKRKTTRNWGLVLAGFGVLFTGLTTMGGVLKGLQHSATVSGFFSSIDCAPAAGSSGMPIMEPLLAIGIGTLVTFMVQSSSAAIGLLLVLSSTGLINFYTAVPILLGSNIGTTTTAMFAVIGANRGARRTAVAHALFNVLGCLIMYVLFFVPWGGHPVFLHIVDQLTTGDAFAGENPARHIANAHTLFNVTCTVLFLPLVSMLAWTCRKVIPETRDEKEEAPRYLEPHLLDTPTLALDRAKSELIYMTGLARKALVDNFEAFTSGTMPNRERLDRREARIDELQHDIADYLVKLAQRDLVEGESRQLPLLMHAVNDAERIGDHAENLLELGERRVERRLDFTDRAQGELRELFGELEAMFRHVIRTLEDGDRSSAERALRCEERVNDLTRELGQNHVRRLEKGECNLISGVVFLDMVANLEKVGDHLTNIAQAGRDLAEVRNGS
ncbi:MAG: Na/Pi symporter [Planctomycetota bacterium]|jgi:Na/Pi-cotransporter